MLAGGALGSFKSAALNFGEYDQSDVHLEVDISKNNQSVFNIKSPSKPLFTLLTDTITIENTYAPSEFGHYKVSYGFKQSETENTPENNSGQAFFNVTDSAYSHADDSAEEAFAYGFEAYGDGPNYGHIMGVVYPIAADCEVNSISAFIAGGKADGLIDFRFKLYLIPAEGDDQTPVEWLMTETVELDSAMLGKWMTLFFDKDGESEFLQAGDQIIAAVEYNNLHEDLFSRRYDNLKIGADYSFKLRDAVTWVGSGTDIGVGYGGNRNLMIRLNINDHSNQIDATDPVTNMAVLGQNYPNPFGRFTEITYELAGNSDVLFEIRDLTGRKVMEINEGPQVAGNHAVKVDASGLEAGLYFYTIRTGSYTETRRMTVAR
jgi:hypothetical protein